MTSRSLRARHLIKEIDERCGGRELDLLSVSMTRGVIPRTEVTDKEARADDLSNYKVCRKGDIVVNRMSAYQGALGMSHQAGIVSPDYIVFRPFPGVEPRWLHHVMRSTWFVSEMSARIRGIGSIGTGNVRTPRVSSEEIRDIRVSVPEAQEQRAIADFLDSETARIDALIDKKQRMVSLFHLQFESRLAAVFEIRGVPTPALSVVVRIAEGQVDPTMEPFASMILIAPDHVESGTGRLLGTSSAADQGAVSGKYICEEGDVIYSKIRPSLRKVCIAPERCLTSADMYPMRPRPELMSQFLRFFLLSDRFSSFAVLESERVAMPKINRDAFGRVRIPIPELHIQRRVVDEIQGAQAHLENLTDRLLRQIELLREHRQALITAAVTGQIEIPGVAA